MKFLANENVAGDAVIALREKGHNSWGQVYIVALCSIGLAARGYLSLHIEAVKKEHL